MSDAIIVDHNYRIDWWELGKDFARLDSDEQAQFFSGMLVGFDEAPLRDYQTQYISDELSKTYHASDVKQLLLDIAEGIE